eukprot:Hpha_TRINITY_DN12510_c0_g3::TRINITY_DN12510_c0_g3_i1::g.50852::m.50852/K04127/cefD; isopenicillin-N epimerase
MGNKCPGGNAESAVGEPVMPGPQGRIQRLEKEVQAYHKSRRAAMNDIGGGFGSKLSEIAFDNAFADKLEASLDSGASKAVLGIAQQDSSSVDWSEWPEVGKTMQTRDGRELEVKFGSNMRELYFHLDPYFLNSASYGATPIPVIKGRIKTETGFQRNPVKWRFTALPGRWSVAKSKLASFMGTDNDYIQILPNANAASNTVLKSLPWELGDRVLIFSTEYDATILACEWLGKQYGVELVTLDLVPPMKDDDVVQALSAKLKEMKSEHGGLPKLVNFCHVTSKTAWIFPAKKIVDVCHKFGISVLCDGAQAAGHLDFTVRDVGADWYVGTAHKWCYTCPGVAFLVTKPHKHATTFPQTVSYFDGQGYDKEFSYYGLQDWSTWLSVVAGLKFVDNVCGGWKEVRKYCQFQADNVSSWCQGVWEEKGLKGPAWLENWPQPLQGEGRYGHMPIVPLPWASEEDATDGDAKKVMASLMLEKVTAFVLVIPVRGTDGKVHNTLGIRCACQIYTCEDDWKYMAEKVADFKGKYGAGEILSDGVSALVGLFQNSDEQSAYHKH